MKNLPLAVAICGTLDIGYAAALAMAYGGSAAAMLRGVAAGPFGDAAVTWGTAGSVLGLIVHFAIMAVMVAVFLEVSRRTQAGSLSPWLSGTLYGLLVYVVMNLIVLPLRWPLLYPQLDWAKALIALFPHIAFVGLPTAFIAARASSSMRPLAPV